MARLTTSTVLPTSVCGSGEHTRRGVWVVGLVLAMVTGGCATPTGDGNVAGLRTDRAGNPVASDDARPLGRLTDLPTCDEAPEAGPVAAPQGLFLPNGAVVTEVEDIGPITSVLAWVPMTPSQARRAYEGADGYEIVMREDEGYDAEVTVTDGAARSFVEIVAICDQASTINIVTSAEPNPE